MHRTAARAALAAALLALAPTGTAHALTEGAIGTAHTTGGDDTRGVDGSCSFAAILPSTSFDTIGVAYDALAYATGPAASTSVVCNLRPSPGSPVSYGVIGITMPGPQAVVAGTAEVPRLIPALYVCVKAHAAYIDEEQAEADESCRPVA